ncbi:VIT1/CCC1 transporter family protein [Aeromicrobium massiliense]|uniref:VIT1/CCC1 transporter family protein n=1 Tax=Aeromicrobium massiliense TaxID=1464554 RepID=UPI0003069B08|nr:VIT1/CCC1 transporter family protein [Aeromicrobium massiliense]
MTEGAPAGEIGHEHADVTGGWLRPAVFGAMDGLVSNFALVMGVSGGTADRDAVVLAGLAGLAAGAFSMAAGEYTSVASQSEAALREVQKERAEILGNGPAEEAELAEMFVEKGMDEDVAREAAADIHRDLEKAVRVHAEVELGVDVDDLPSPTLAAVSSFGSFAVGAVLPLLPFLLGAATVWPAVAVSLVALFGCGALVTRLTSRPWWFGGLRQLLLGGLAAALTYGFGSLVGGAGL